MTNLLVSNRGEFLYIVYNVNVFYGLEFYDANKSRPIIYHHLPIEKENQQISTPLPPNLWEIVLPIAKCGYY